MRCNAIAIRFVAIRSGLPGYLHGYTIAMVSDVHGGPLVGAEEVATLVAQLNALGADAELYQSASLRV